MVTLSKDKTFRRVRVPSLQERNSVSYQVRVAGGFAFLYNSLGEYKRLFPIKTPASISFKIIGDVAIFIVVGAGTYAVVFNLLTSALQHTELDTSSFPSITEKGVFYSREGQIIYRELLDTLGEEQILATLPGEYLAYAFEDPSGCHLVTKLIDNSIIKHEGDCTRIPLEVVWN